jgi:PAS domain S-box-containing protein
MEFEKYLYRITDELPLGLIVLKSNGIISCANRWICERLEIGRDDLIGSTMQNSLKHVAKYADLCLTNNRPVSEVMTIHGIGKVNVALRPLVENNSTVGAVCCFSMLRIKDPYSDSIYNSLGDQELDAIFKLSSDGILLCDGKGTIIKINEASLRLNGWSADEVLGKNVMDLVNNNQIDASVTLKVFDSGTQVNMMQHIKRTEKHLLTTGTPVYDENGKIKLVVVNERDLTELNAIKTELQDARKVSEKFRDELAELSSKKVLESKIVAESKAMQQVIKYASKVAEFEVSNVLVLGESGTGKGLIARHIHETSNRQGPMISINCAALPETLLEAELFGYEKGAFTGANKTGKAGLIELAHEGTLFLDEIGDCALSIQAKLLKYLDDYRLIRLGSVKSKKIDCNIIAATNQDLEVLIKTGSFRSDLFYRLNTFTIQIPPLRERPEDTVELVLYYLERFNTRYDLRRKVSPRVLQHLQAYQFLGNVRELKNTVKKAVVMSDTDVLDEYILNELHYNKETSYDKPANKYPAGTLHNQLGHFEKKILKKTMSVCRSTREMARLLGTSQPTIVRRLKKHGLPLPSKL